MNFHETGIFFDMPEAEYHADPSLSSSGIKNLLASPLNYWINSPLNHDREEGDSSAAQDEGTAWHKRILEGADAFWRIVVTEPEGINKRTKAWTEFKEKHPDKIILSPKQIDHIDLAARGIEESAEVRNLFGGGNSEVSIFWQDEATGVRMKRRIDYLKPGLIVELKTFANQKSRPPAQEVGRHMAEHHYGIDAHASLDAVYYTRGHPMTLATPQFFFLFLQKGKVPHVVLREFEPGCAYSDNWKADYRRAIALYKECVDRWGYDQPWIEPATLAKFDESEIPSWAWS